MYDRFSVTETGGVKVESGDLRQAAHHFFEVLIHIGRNQAKGVERSFRDEQHPTILLPQKGKLPAGMTGDVNRPDAPCNRDHLPILDLVFHSSWFNPCSMSEASIDGMIYPTFRSSFEG